MKTYYLMAIENDDVDAMFNLVYHMFPYLITSI